MAGDLFPPSEEDTPLLLILFHRQQLLFTVSCSSNSGEKIAHQALVNKGELLRFTLYLVISDIKQ